MLERRDEIINYHHKHQNIKIILLLLIIKGGFFNFFLKQ